MAECNVNRLDSYGLSMDSRRASGLPGSVWAPKGKGVCPEFGLIEGLIKIEPRNQGIQSRSERSNSRREKFDHRLTRKSPSLRKLITISPKLL